jgi:iron complex transport system ATP-binding protein
VTIDAPHTATPTPLAAEDVWAGYADTDAVRGVTLRARAGALTGIIGANGAGKSTLLRVLLGTLAPRRGRVLLHGVDASTVPLRERAARVAYVAQRPGVAFAFSACEVVQLGCPWLGGTRARDAGLEALAEVGLVDRADDALETLSVGQQQRVSLARALAQVRTRPASPHAVAVLADEPVASMDPAHAIESMDLLRGLASGGACVVVVLHDLTLASRYADDLLLLNTDGSPHACGPTGDVLTPAKLEHVYATPFSQVAPGVMLPSRLRA